MRERRLDIAAPVFQTEYQPDVGPMLQKLFLSRGLDPLLTRLEARGRLSDAERDALRDAAGPIQTFDAGEDIAAEHSSPDHCLLIVGGMAGRHNLLENGERQITAFHIIGDFVDLQGFLLPKLDHGVSALTKVTAMQFPHAALHRITDQYPHLTRMLWLSTIVDGAVHRQWLVAMGRMTSLGHLAHLFCEQYVRARTVGMAPNGSFPFELKQMHLADALGLSVVHVNRTVQQLRRRSLIEWENGVLTILDWTALQTLGKFDDTYLDVKDCPR